MLKKVINYPIILLCIVIFVSLTGCAQVEESNEIFIGVAWPFETMNGLFNEGLELAVKKINNSGGIKDRELRLIKKDDGAELERGMAIAQSFAENKNIQAVIGHYNSHISIPASTVYNNAGIVMLSPGSTAPDLTNSGYEYVFRGLPSDDEIARQLSLYAAKQGYERMVIYYSDDTYGNGLANSFEDHARAQGITIVDRVNYYNDLQNLKQLHSRWQAFGFDGIFVAEIMPGGARFIYDTGRAGIDVPVIAGEPLDSPSLPQIGGNVAEGTVVGSVFNPQLDSPEVREFVQEFMEEYGVTPSAYAALGYDAVNMLAAALENSDLSNPSTVAAELRYLGEWPGVAGTHAFNEKGENTGDLVVLKKLQGGYFKYLERWE